MAFGFHLHGQFIRNGVIQTLEMRRKDRFKISKKLADQFAVIVYRSKQFRYIEDRRCSDIHLHCPLAGYLARQTRRCR